MFEKLSKDFGVRSLFGTILICGYIVLFTFTLFYRANLLDKVIQGFSNIVMAIVAFYFGSKTNH